MLHRDLTRGIYGLLKSNFSGQVGTDVEADPEPPVPRASRDRVA